MIHVEAECTYQLHKDFILRGSEWGLVFSVICPYLLVFTVKLTIFLMFTVLEKNIVQRLKGDPKVIFKDLQILSAL